MMLFSGLPSEAIEELKKPDIKAFADAIFQVTENKTNDKASQFKVDPLHKRGYKL